MLPLGQSPWLFVAVSNPCCPSVSDFQRTALIDHQAVSRRFGGPRSRPYSPMVSDLAICGRAESVLPTGESSTTRLHLIVLDTDDNGPEFDAERFRLRVAENQPAGTEVPTLIRLFIIFYF